MKPLQVWMNDETNVVAPINGRNADLNILTAQTLQLALRIARVLHTGKLAFLIQPASGGHGRRHVIAASTVKRLAQHVAHGHGRKPVKSMPSGSLTESRSVQRTGHGLKRRLLWMNDEMNVVAPINGSERGFKPSTASGK